MGNEKRRPLNRDERKICEIHLKKHKDILNDIDSEIKLADFRLDFEIDYTAQREKKRFGEMKKKAQQNREFIQKKIDIMQDQLENGVAPKEKNNGDKEVKEQ